MTKRAKAVGRPQSSSIPLKNRKARGSGHERVDEILAAARAIFLEHGVANVTTRQIASRVGMSHAALYVYFKGKDEMLDRLVEAAFQKLGATISRIDAQHHDPIDFLRALIPDYMRFGLENPDEYRIAFLLRDGRHKAAQSQAERDGDVGFAVFQVLVDRVSAGVRSGKLAVDGSSALQAAQVLWAAMHGLVALLLAYPDFGWSSVEDLASAQTNMLLGGMIAEDDARGSHGTRKKDPSGCPAKTPGRRRN